MGGYNYVSKETWECTQDQLTFWNMEWKNRIFIFVGSLYDDYENIKSQILNSEKFKSIEEVYSKVEAEVLLFSEECLA